MKSIAIAAIGTLFTSAVIAASAPAPSPSSQASTKSQSTQTSKGSTMASTQSTQGSTTTTTTQRGPSKTGQPSQDCETLGNQPGNSMSAPGSAFNPNGTSGTKYAGEQPQNSRNTASVSQYDVACARPSK